MRRLLALLAMLAFVAATAAPAMAMCRMRAAQRECCCKPAPANSLCAPDCCDTTIKAPTPIAEISTNVRVFLVLGDTRAVSFSNVVPSPRCLALPIARLLVGLHERAAPRLPLRV